MLRFRVWCCAGARANPPSSWGLDWSTGAGNDVSPVYPFFVFFGGVVESPVSSGAIVRLKTDASRDPRRPNCFHGPGESVANSGDGRGVRSPMAEMTGLATVELAAEAEPKGPY